MGKTRNDEKDPSNHLTLTLTLHKSSSRALGIAHQIQPNGNANGGAMPILTINR
jgi:hypothetical protein